MTTTYDMELEQILESIFATMFDCKIARVAPRSRSTGTTLTASIQISGDWVGSVVLDMHPQTARAAAGAMLRIPHETVAEEDCHDVAAELVNIVGGNLKSLLPGGSHLSLPTVVVGSDFGLHMHAAELLDEIWFDSTVGLLHVALYSKSIQA